MNDEFDSLVHDVFYYFMEVRPDIATSFGLHQYDRKMPSATKEAQETFLKTLSEYLQKLQDINQDDLSPNRRIDRNLMIYTLKCNLLDGEIRWWEKDPDVTAIVGGALLPLFAREFAPLEKRLHSITARIDQIPKFIKEFSTRIETPVELWREIAKEACGMLPFYFQVISDCAQHQKLDVTELEEASTRASDALTEYKAWLNTLPCEDTPLLGKDLFERVLQVRELGLTADEILALGENYLRREKKKLKELTTSVDPSSSVRHVRDQVLSSSPPTFEDTVKGYENAITLARELVSAREFATLPKNERLVIMETPSFLKHLIPMAAYSPPARFEEDQLGIYYVTRTDSLKEHNYAAIVNTSIHEGYPGHHLQAVWANKNPSLARKLTFVPEFVEGWAHYCEERMRDYGLNDLNLQIGQTIATILRAVRMICDVKLHCGKMALHEVVFLLEKETGMGHAAAFAEAREYTRSPAGPLSYLLGKYLLLQLQEDVRAHKKEKYSEKQFHDALLQAGNMPFRYLKEELKLKGML